MNILFLSIIHFDSIESHSIYYDLLRCFRDNGHHIFAICLNEKRLGKETEVIHEKGTEIVRIKTGNVTKNSNLISKGISQLTLEQLYTKAIKDFYSDVKFDLVLYSTPPITFYKAIKYVKKRDGANSYLLLKDIFPQNAVDLGMMTKNGPKSVIYRYFRNKERKLYSISDRIGCMSPANVGYLLKHNPDVTPSKVEICPNAIEVSDKSVDDKTRIAIREKYGLPINKKVFIYGGNLGKPQGISFLIDCLKEQKNEQAFYLIVGNGTEYSKIEAFLNENNPANVKLMNRLSKEEFDRIVAACDVGMIFLDNRFTIPNFPSRILSYMQAKIPVLAVTDESTDIGDIIQAGKFGWWCPSTNVSCFIDAISDILSLSNDAFYTFKHNSFEYLKSNYDVEDNYKRIIEML